MKKLFKILAITVAVIVLLALTATTLLGLFVDPNDFKKEIQQVALEQAQLELKINGDISWSIYPSIGLDIQSIEASYANKEPLASLEQAQVSVMLAPLFSGNIEMKAINIQGLKLNLVKDNTTNNWQSAPAKDQGASSTQNGSKTSEQSDSPTPTTDDTNSSVNKIDIQSISVTGAAINYLDKTNGQLFKVSNFNLSTDRVQSGQPFNAKLDLDLAMEQAGKQTLSSSVALEGLFNLDVAQQKYAIKQLNSQIKVITDKTIDLQLKGDLEADLNSNQLSIDDLSINAGKLNAVGALKISGETFQNIQGKLAVKAFDLKALLKELKLAPITTSNDASLRSIALSTELKGDAKGFNFNNLSLNIDKTKINGGASYQLSNGFISFNLQGDSINVSDYLASSASASNPASTSASQKSAAKTKSNTAYSKEQIIPIEVLRDLKLKGQLNFKQLQYQQTKLTNLALNVDANKGIINIAKLNMNAYQGSINTSVRLDARKEPLRINVNNKVSNLQIGPVLQHFAQTDAMTGTLSSSSQLALSGQSVHSLVNSLTGKVNVTLAKGVINGINAAQKMCETVNSISSLGGTLGTTQAVDKATPFASIKGNFNIKNGVVSNKDFNADLDAINAKGKGSVNLPKQSLNYRLGLNIKDNLFNKSCSVNNKIQGIEWPIDCKGKFSDDPLTLCKPDMSVIKDIAKKALEAKLKKKLEKKLGGSIKEKKKELKQKVEEKVKDKLKDALKGLF